MNWTEKSIASKYAYLTGYTALSLKQLIFSVLWLMLSRVSTIYVFQENKYNKELIRRKFVFCKEFYGNENEHTVYVTLTDKNNIKL